MGLLVILFHKWPNELNAYNLTHKQNLRCRLSTLYKNPALIVRFVNIPAVIRSFLLTAEEMSTITSKYKNSL